MGGVSFSFFLNKISCTCCGSLSWGCGAWCGVSVLGVMVCLVGRSRAWLVRCIRSRYGSHGLFSGRMRLAGSSLSLVSCLGRVPCLVLGHGSASVVLERDLEQV